MAEPAVLHPPQYDAPFPQIDLPDHPALIDPIDSMDFPADLPFVPDFLCDFDFVGDVEFSIDDFLDFPDPQGDPPPESTTGDLPFSEGSNSRDGCGVTSEDSRNLDHPSSDGHDSDSASPNCCVYIAESPGSRSSGTVCADASDVKSEWQGGRKDRSLKRKKGRCDEDESVIPNNNSNGNARSNKFRRPGPLDEADSSCLFSAGNEDNEKKNLRLMRNRESAQLSRQRKKQYVEELEEKVKSMHSTISDLNGRIAYFVAENASLRQQLFGSVGKGGPPAVYPCMPPMAPIHFPWIPYSGYGVRAAGSQVPLVPIPKLKSQQPTVVAKAKKSEGKKAENRTKKVASVSLLGLLFFMLIVGAIVSGGDFRYGDLFTGTSGIASRSRGRVLTVSGNVDQMDQTTKYKHCSGDHLHDKRSGRETDGKIEGGSHTIPCSNESSISGNANEPLFASLYVPRNDRLIKIDGNLIISSVLAGERTKVQTSSRVKGYTTTHTSGKGGKEADLAIPSSVSSALAVVNSGRYSHMYRATSENKKALPSGSTDMYADNWNAASSDRLPQDWFQEGLEGPIFSSGVCTEVFQFGASQQSGIIPATSVANTTKNITEKSPCPGGKLRNRRFLYPQPIPLGGSTSNDTEEVVGSHRPHDNNVNTPKASNSLVVSVLVDPREAGDIDNDGMIMPKSISRIFVVVLVDSVKYITYSCVLPFKSTAPHLVTR